MPVIIIEPRIDAAIEGEKEVYGPVDTETASVEQTCEDSGEGEIVVCGARNDDQYRVKTGVPPPPTAMEELAKKLQFKIGPAELLPGGPNGSVGIGIRIRF